MKRCSNETETFQLKFKTLSIKTVQNSLNFNEIDFNLFQLPSTTAIQKHDTRSNAGASNDSWL